MLVAYPFIMIAAAALAVVFTVVYIRRRARERNTVMLLNFLGTVCRREYPVPDALRALAKGTEGRFSGDVNYAASLLEQGLSLSHALYERTRLLSPEDGQLLEAGEHSGRLVETLEVLNGQAHRRDQGPLRFVASAAYPLGILVMLGATTALLMRYILPKVKQICTDYGAAYPEALTWIVPVWTALFWLGVVLAARVATFVIPDKYRPGVAKFMGLRVLPKRFMPLSRRYGRWQAIRVFAQSMALLLRGGVPMRDALRGACEVVTAPWTHTRLTKLRKLVEQGESLSAAGRRCGLFPARHVHLLAMGEAGGDLATVLDEIAEDAITRCEKMIDRVVNIEFPLWILAIGVFVGTMVIGIFQFFARIIDVM